METNNRLTIEKRIVNNKESVIERLKKLPIVQIACEKTGIGRATYYRWRKQDKDFAKEADKAIVLGRQFINEMAESQLLSQIKEQNMTAIIFWLKHNHAIYGNRLELTGKLKHELGTLSKEQEKMIEKALRLASLLPSKSPQGEKDE